MRIAQATARERFAQARSARLATVDASGVPHLVPVTFALVRDGDTDLIGTAVDAKPKSTRQLRRLRNIADNPRVCLLADHYSDDWRQLWWVRADGTASTAEIDDHPGLLHELGAKYEQYAEQPPQGPLIVVRVERWAGWAYG